MKKDSSKLLLGTAYYPEHDQESEWDIDAQLMQKLGIDTARIGEFCWSRMQQPDGTFTLDWVERCIDTLHRHGIKTVLCTPSACPPAWMMDRYPDLPCETPDGRKGLFGGRRHYSVFHEGYREASRRLAAEMARRFGKHPAVVGWQLDNEVGSYYTVDCSSPALKAFHLWLKRRYGTVEEINKRWGLIFWNQEVQSIEQVPAPTEMMCTRNPSYLLDYNRFCLEGMADFLLAQAQAIRQFVPENQFVVASAVEQVMYVILEMQKSKGVNWIDEISIHNYPELAPELGQVSMHLDRFRSMSHDTRFLVLEQQIGSSRTTTGGLDPDIRRFWAFQALAHGAKGICWFHWRRFRTGCEWRLTPVLERDRKPRAAFNSLQNIVSEMRRIEPILANAKVWPDIQILLSLDNALAHDRATEAMFWMAIQLPDATANRFPLWERATRTRIYNPLSRFGQTMTFVGETGKWDPALPLMIPELDICTPAMVAKLEDFCRQGGTVICFPGAGERDENGAHMDSPPPGILSQLFGVELFDYVQLETEPGPTFNHAKGCEEAPEGVLGCPTAAAKIQGSALQLDARHAEVLEIKDAEAIGAYTDGPFAGKAFISSRKIGTGRAVYIGAVPADDQSLECLYKILLPDNTTRTRGAQFVHWQGAQGNFIFVINGSPSEFVLCNKMVDHITGKEISKLPPWGVAIVAQCCK